MRRPDRSSALPGRRAARPAGWHHWAEPVPSSRIANPAPAGASAFRRSSSSFLVLLVVVRFFGTGSLARRPVNLRLRQSLPAFFFSADRIPESTPPYAVLEGRDAPVPSAPQSHRIATFHDPTDDAHARKHSGSECACRLRSCHCRLRFEQQTAPNPTPARAAIGHNLRHSQGCRNPAILPATELRARVRERCSDHSIRSPAEAAPHAASFHSLTFLSA